MAMLASIREKQNVKVSVTKFLQCLHENRLYISSNYPSWGV